ncbi:MAG: hypothetical protein K2Q22_18190, partial [Cytophagales bacterium]|nr:hypothetical protein [Cytophagales bacterium]
MAGISVGHIHNPVLNGDLETNQEYLAKTEYAIKNLVSITKFMGHNPSFVHDVTLLRVLAKLRKFGLDYLVLGLYITCCNPIRKSLVSGNTNLYLFDFYKLGFLIREYKC